MSSILHLLCRRTAVFVLLGVSLPGCSNASPSTRAADAQAAARTKIAQAKFEAYCKGAGEKITRTVEGVDGVFLLKLRPQGRNFGKQFVMDDPYGDDSNGDRFIESFMREKIHHDTPITTGGPLRNGYRYVDALGEDGQRYRYTGRWIEPWQTDKSYLQGYKKFVMDKNPATAPAPRYGVTYDDISTHEDREYWIAGSSLRVIDLQTNEVIAERIGYMWDPGQGNNSGGRSPWAAAADYACPGFIKRFGGYKPRVPAAVMQELQTEDFVEKVLIPKAEK
jgi:hypothetical protein